MQGLRQLSTFIGQTFALWAIVFAIAGFTAPQVFTPFKPAIPYALGIIMFGMGLTLRARDFAEILRRPFQVLLGVVAQFLIMPLLAVLLVHAFSLEPMVALGVILLGYLLGLLAARAAGLNNAQRRAIMIEVGMQNSALGATLGTKYFSPEAALPSAIFSVWHNISGALVANICTWWDKRHGK